MQTEKREQSGQILKFTSKWHDQVARDKGRMMIFVIRVHAQLIIYYWWSTYRHSAAPDAGFRLWRMLGSLRSFALPLVPNILKVHCCGCCCCQVELVELHLPLYKWTGHHLQSPSLIQRLIHHCCSVNYSKKAVTVDLMRSGGKD